MLVNDKIPLSLVLWDGDQTKTVKAIVRSGKDEITGSPVIVPHNSFGNYFYKSVNLLVPEGAKVITVEFIVYEDSGMTVESSLHERAHDIYEVTQAPSQSEISDKLDSIITIVTSHGLNDRLVGHVYSDNLTGFTLDEELEGFIYKDDVLTGFINDTSLASVVSSDNISGSI